MAEAVGQSLSFAVGVAISPIPMVGLILMLTTPRARSNGTAFLLSWFGGVLGAGAIILLIAGAGQASEDGQPAEWVSFLKIALAILLLGLAARQWRGRPRAGRPARLPQWMRTVDSFTRARAAGFGLILSAFNPKNLLLILGGASAIAQTGASTGAQAAALAIFALLASVGVGAPLALYLLMGERSTAALDDLKSWMVQHNSAIMAVLCVIIAAKLFGDAISSLPA